MTGSFSRDRSAIGSVRMAKNLQQVADQDANHVALYDGLFHFLHLIGAMGCHLLSGAGKCAYLLIIIIMTSLVV